MTDKKKPEDISHEELMQTVKNLRVMRENQRIAQVSYLAAVKATKRSDFSAESPEYGELETQVDISLGGFQQVTNELKWMQDEFTATVAWLNSREV